MINSKKRVIGVGVLSGLLLLAAGQQALAQEEMSLSLTDKQSDIDQLRMYFSDEELVDVTTRAPMPLPRVAENVSIVTSEQIEAMGVHSVEEVLSQLPGMIVNFAHKNMGDVGYYRTHGLGFQDAPHMLLLIDGMRLNPPSQASPQTNGIPLQIIKRIEVIKGPASSIWGSSLGGVINIITKDTGATPTPQGQVSGSYGEAGTQDYNADMAAKTGPFSYYLYAGRQDSQGLRDDRWFKNDRFYGKVETGFGDNIKLGLTLGYSQPDFFVGNFASWDGKTLGSSGQSWRSLNLETKPMTGVNLRLALQSGAMDWGRKDYVLSTGAYMDDYSYADETLGGEAILYISRWQGHNVVLGAEIQRDEIEAIWGGFGPGVDGVHPVDQERKGFFINNSMEFGALTMTPGIRYDQSSMIGDHTSLSLAAVYRLRETTVLRLSVGQGFAQMPLQHFLFNPDIKPETIKSVQGGVETDVMNALRLKTTLFHHDIEHTIDFGSSTNSLPIQRNGIEAEIETYEWQGFSSSLNATYVYEHNSDSGLGLGIDGENDNITVANMAFSYRYDDLLRTRLAGHYFWYDTWTWMGPDHKSSAMLWDFSIGVTPGFFPERRLTLFGSVHNLFDGAVFWSPELKNPGRWVEAGISIKY